MRSQTVYKRTSNICWALSVLLLVTTLAQVARAQNASPTLIPFQGRLTDQNGVAYTNGQYTLTFNLYDQAVGGSTVWTERHEKVGVINGTVNVFLGSIQSIGNVAFDTTKYLGITVDADDNPATADPEMVPRTMIIPAFWAKRAELATNSNLLANHGWNVLFNNGDPLTGKIDATKLADGSISANQIAPNAITVAKLAASSVGASQIIDGTISVGKLAGRRGPYSSTGGLGAFVSSSVVPANFPSQGTTPLLVPELSVTLQTSGRPVCIMLQGPSIKLQNATGGARSGVIEFARNGTIVRGTTIRSDVSGATLELDIPSSSVAFVDTGAAAGTHTFDIRIRHSSGAPVGTLTLQNDLYLIAYEL